MGGERRRVFVLGLTGSLGSGKSTLAGIFRELGVRVIDADAIARRALEPGNPPYEEAVRAFGPEIVGPDGRVDRVAVARKVFADEVERRRLEGIVHPWVRQEERRLIAEASPGEIVVVDVPLLFETGMERECDKVCVVIVDEDSRLARLKARGMGPEEIGARLAAQMSQAEKVRRSDYAIDNSGSLDALRREAGRLLAEWRNLAGRETPAKE